MTTLYIGRDMQQWASVVAHATISCSKLQLSRDGTTWFEEDDANYVDLEEDALKIFCRVLGIKTPRRGKQIKVTVTKSAKCKVENVKDD